MMRKFIAVFMLFALCACGSAYNRPWQVPENAPRAQKAPQNLMRKSDSQPTQADPGLQRFEPTPQNGTAGPMNSYQARMNGVQAHPDAPFPYGTENGDTPPGAYGEDDYSYGEGPDYDPYYDSYAVPPPQTEIVTALPALPPVKIALLVPLSGEHKDLGQALLQAAQLAVFDAGYDSFELMPRDTGSTAQGARQAAEAAIQNGAQLILGPVFASSVQAVKPVTQRYNVNMIGFSTDWTLAGGNTYIMGFLPFAQVQRIAEYAAANGLHKIGILAPNTDYGNAVIAAYNSLSYRLGLETADVVRFPADESDISGIVRSFARYDERVEALNQQTLPLKERLKNNPGDRAARAELARFETMNSWGEPPFDAVLLPVGGDQARSIGNLLSFYDLDPERVKRLGTGLWDDPGLATEKALDGAWFAAPSPTKRQNFESRYQALYGNRPLRLASLAYDATALAAALGRNGYYTGGRPSFDHQALTNPNGFAGLDGIFRFRPNGLVERGLAVMEFRDGNIRVIDEAPTTFQRQGF